MPVDMARAKAAAKLRNRMASAARGTVRIKEDWLELDVEGSHEIDLLRRWQGRVNGPAYPQPYLVEGPRGRFRLYVGDAAERVRTRRGMV
jgi:hypothetical protein